MELSSQGKSRKYTSRTLVFELVSVSSNVYATDDADGKIAIIEATIITISGNFRRRSMVFDSPRHVFKRGTILQ